MTNEKNGNYTSIICKPFCSFYRAGKDDIFCGTYRYLMETVPINDVSAVPSSAVPDFSEDSWIKEHICKTCDFFVEGCDYREGNPSPPCGGYVVVEWLRKHL